MKKLFYILLLSAVTCVSISSCTKEVVEPKVNGTMGGAAKE